VRCLHTSYMLQYQKLSVKLSTVVTFLPMHFPNSIRHSSHCALASCGTVYCNRSCLRVCVIAMGGRAESEPYYSQCALSVCVSLSTFFILQASLPKLTKTLRRRWHLFNRYIPGQSGSAGSTAGTMMEVVVTAGDDSWNDDGSGGDSW